MDTRVTMTGFKDESNGAENRTLVKTQKKGI